MRTSRTHILSAFFLALIFFSGLARADSGDCKKNYIQLARGFIANYVSEVRQEGWPRLLLKRIDPNDPGGFHFFSPYQSADAPAFYWAPIYHSRNFLFRIVTKRLYGKPHDFTPLGGLVHTVFNRPVRLATRTFGPRKLQPTLPITMASLLGAGILSNILINLFYVDQLEEHAKATIERDAPKWDELIEHDYAYRDIFEQREKDVKAGKANAQSHARELAYNRYHSLLKYYQHIAEHGEEVEKSGQLFFGNPLFTDLNNIMLNGFQLTEGYQALEGFDDFASEDQIEELFQLKHSLFAVYNAIHLMVLDPETFAQRKEQDKDREVFEAISDDPFTQKLLRYYSEGTLNQKQLLFHLKEDAFWRVRIEQWRVSRIAKLKKINGKYSDVALTLEDIQKQTTDEIDLAKASKRSR